MPTVEAPISACPICGSEVWDNTQNKKNPKGPDFKCKSCSEGFWLPKAKPLTYKPPAGASNASYVAPHVLPGSRDDDLVALYWDSFDNVLAGLAKRKLTDLFGKDIGALVSTLYIQRARG